MNKVKKQSKQPLLSNKSEKIAKPENVVLPKGKDSKKWFLFDAKGQVIGRLSTKIATKLLGKNKVTFLPYMDSGDYVVVINAAKISATGRKENQKKYYRYSGYPGGLKIRDLKTLRSERPEEIIRHSVSGMLPKTRLGKEIIKKLYIYPGESHPHQAQKLEEIKI